mmetsp:Transcript_58673/g.155162  ORF Transcript_58673/g.155162 Transcript_58673/m.155162 type:complete len:214 (+) Transcript_58673:92-733(+)
MVEAHLSGQQDAADGYSKRVVRVVLTADDAAAIFQMRPSSDVVKSQNQSASAVARKYGVSSKTIRDIWQARSWSRATLHLDSSRPAPVKRRVGRPKGAKDLQPRQKFGYFARGLRNQKRREELASEMESQTRDCTKSKRRSRTSVVSLESLQPPTFAVLTNTNAVSEMLPSTNIDNDSYDRVMDEDVSVDWILDQWESGSLNLITLPDPFYEF